MLNFSHDVIYNSNVDLLLSSHVSEDSNTFSDIINLRIIKDINQQILEDSSKDVERLVKIYQKNLKD